MAGFLSKFIRGAATQGSTLLADQAQQKFRSELQAKRDAVLNDNRMASETSRRKFESVEAEKGREFQLERDVSGQEFRSAEAEKGRAFQRERDITKEKERAESPRGKLEQLELDKANKVAALTKDYETAKTEQGRIKAINSLLVATGRASDLKKVVKAGGTSTVQGLTLVSNVYKSLLQQQADAMDVTDTRPPEELFNHAFDIVEKRVLAAGGRPIPKSKAKDTVVKASDIKPGERTATNPITGDKMVERGGQWLPITQ